MQGFRDSQQWIYGLGCR